MSHHSIESTKENSESSEDEEMEDEEEFEISDEPSKVKESDSKKTICEVWYEKVNSSKVNTKDYEIVYCESCLWPAHKACIGRNLEFKLFKRPQDDKEKEPIYDKMFKCDRCVDEYQDTVKWSLCHKGEGLMKKVYKIKTPESKLGSQSEFVHLCWALFWDNYCVVDYNLMTISRIKATAFGDERAWSYCHSNQGYLIIWDRMKWKVSAHVYCFNEEKKEFLGEDRDSQDIGGWEISFKQITSHKFIEKKRDFGIESALYPIIKEERNNDWIRGGYPCFKWDIHKDEEDYRFSLNAPEPNPESLMLQCDQWGKILDF